MYKNILIALTIIYSYQSFAQNNPSETDQVIPHSQFTISLINLIATPEKYDGKLVQVIGYLTLEFEGKAIYLHKEDYVRGISDNGFWVDFSKEILDKKDIMNYNKKYVIIVGTFDMKSLGHMGMFGRTLKNITRLDFWDTEN